METGWAGVTWRARGVASFEVASPGRAVVSKAAASGTARPGMASVTA
jgi:hypothetical protein